MTQPRDPDALLSAYLADGMQVLPDRVVDSVLDEIHRTRQRAELSPWRLRSLSRTALGAAAVVAVLVLSGMFYVIQRGQSAVGGPSPTPAASSIASQPAVVGPSPTPSAPPSPTPTPLLWTEASLKEDWPAPVRPEAVGEAILAPFRFGVSVPDPLGDTGSDGHLWVDIQVVEGSGAKFFIELVDNHPPLVDPTEQWIAYGVVVDDDRDGIPDWRYGIDNLPVTETDHSRPGRRHRAWRTNLHTGRTVADAGPPYDLDTLNTYSFDTFYPPGGYGPEGARISFGGDLAGGGTDPGLVDPFYTWASVIVDGRVVATDYAPDIGWLDPSKAK